MYTSASQKDVYSWCEQKSGITTLRRMPVRVNQLPIFRLCKFIRLNLTIILTHQEQFEILNGKPIGDEMEEFRNMIDWELNGCEMEYCKKRVPEDVREEERESRKVNNKCQTKESFMLEEDDLDKLFKASC